MLRTPQVIIRRPGICTLSKIINYSYKQHLLVFLNIDDSEEHGFVFINVGEWTTGVEYSYCLIDLSPHRLPGKKTFADGKPERR